jgi:hypothetical protein
VFLVANGIDMFHMVEDCYFKNISDKLGLSTIPIYRYDCTISGLYSQKSKTSLAQYNTLDGRYTGITGCMENEIYRKMKIIGNIKNKIIFCQ